MKTFIIKEFDTPVIENSQCYDLNQKELKNCVGCWTCWWKTPGICVFNDMEDFYRGYVNADKVIIFAKLEHGFVTSKMKTLLDRMIPLFLPYTTSAEGGTWHIPRYPKYPDVDFYYDYDFEDEEEQRLLQDYIVKVFRQFHSIEIMVRHISHYREETI